MKERLLGKTPDELKAIALEAGLPAFAGKQMAQWLYQMRVKTLDEMTNLSKVGREAPDFEVETLDGDTFRKILASENREEVHVTMPKYSVTYCNDGMEQQLSAMGMPLAFSAQGADFSKMGKDTSGNLYIGAVVHKTKVDVDEDGTKAAAVSAAVMKASCAPVAKPKVVKLNRPFVYAIVDNATKLPVFIGTVNTIGK